MTGLIACFRGGIFIAHKHPDKFYVVSKPATAHGIPPVHACGIKLIHLHLSGKITLY